MGNQPLSCRNTLGDAWPMVERLLLGTQNVSTLPPPQPRLYLIIGVPYMVRALVLPLCSYCVVLRQE